ncbi:ACT domain-containing protein [Candidatus Micrarchaeota archaeon]|nr:ACT domain-containing protein [Candidatus Micrarchaeota archaeon]
MTVANYLEYIVDIFREEEGISILFMESIVDEMKELSDLEIAGPFAMITLNVYSDLMAVGFLAKMTEVLAAKKISVNAFSAYHHDHIFVPYEKKDEAMVILKTLSKA